MDVTIDRCELGRILRLAVGVIGTTPMAAAVPGCRLKMTAEGEGVAPSPTLTLEATDLSAWVSVEAPTLGATAASVAVVHPGPLLRALRGLDAETVRLCGEPRPEIGHCVRLSVTGASYTVPAHPADEWPEPSPVAPTGPPARVAARGLRAAIRAVAVGELPIVWNCGDTGLTLTGGPALWTFTRTIPCELAAGGVTTRSVVLLPVPTARALVRALRRFGECDVAIRTSRTMLHVTSAAVTGPRLTFAARVTTAPQLGAGAVSGADASAEMVLPRLALLEAVRRVRSMADGPLRLHFTGSPRGRGRMVVMGGSPGVKARAGLGLPARVSSADLWMCGTSLAAFLRYADTDTVRVVARGGEVIGLEAGPGFRAMRRMGVGLVAAA